MGGCGRSEYGMAVPYKPDAFYGGLLEVLYESLEVSDGRRHGRFGSDVRVVVVFFL